MGEGTIGPWGNESWSRLKRSERVEVDERRMREIWLEEKSREGIKGAFSFA